MVLGNVGLVYGDRSEYGRALEYYQHALRIFEELGDKIGQAWVVNNIGNIYNESSDYERALEHYQRSLRLYGELGDKRGQAAVLGNIGRIYSGRSEYGRALEHYQRALRLFEELGDKWGQAIVLANLGEVYTKLGRFREAERYLLQAIQIDSSLGTQSHLMNDYFALSDLYELLGGTYKRGGRWAESVGYLERALVAYKRASVLKDTLFGEESRKQVMRKELEHEYEKKRIEEQARHEVELARREARLRQQRLVMGSIGVLLVVAIGFLVWVERQRRVIARQKRVVEEQKRVVEEQRELLSEKNRQIEESIQYARRIQEAILPSKERWESVLSESFVLYWPRDIVAGDFYWLEEVGEYVFVAVADCTGHGVPGAMMSVLCSGALRRAVLEEGIMETGLILDRVRAEVVEQVHRGGVGLRDGMDVVLIRFRRGDMRWVQFSGANRRLWVVRPSGQVVEVEGDRQPVGYVEWARPFRSEEVVLEEGSMLYLFTDGYVDQLGGTSGRKLGTKRLREWVVELHRESCAVQGERFGGYFEGWRGGMPQVDDVTLVGLRVV